MIVMIEESKCIYIHVHVPTNFADVKLERICEVGLCKEEFNKFHILNFKPYTLKIKFKIFTSSNPNTYTYSTRSCSFV